MIDLLGYARGTRWFGSQPADVLGTSLTDWWVRPQDAGLGVRSGFLDVALGGERARFHIPLGYVPTGSSEAPVLGRETIDGVAFDIVDALDDHRCRMAVLGALAAQHTGFELLRPLPGPVTTSRRFGGEQSNTTVIYDDVLMMKIFRRVWPGPNPDLECHRALAGDGVATLYGRWHHDGQDLALAVELLPQPVDGYQAARDAALAGRPFATEAAAVGAALALVHRGLSARLPTGVVEAAPLRAAWHARLAEACAEVPALEGLRADLARHFDAVPDLTLPSQRIHGDCHLGQTILSRGAWFYVDFEGEPMVPLTRRREPDLAVRDVAGMLRSFGYAAAGADASWLADCREAFLDGYGPLTDAERQVLLALEIDKACYEVRYEHRYRPALVEVPFGYLRRVASSGR
ncbi:MAG TPA: hypothetical protein PKE40_16370 [Arachnia sp.]|nr:hypothetical protein [Arachnia sp.]